MDYSSSSSSKTAFNFLIRIVLILVGLTAVYFLYKFLMGAGSIQSTSILTNDTVATSPPIVFPTVPAPYEGGDYSVSTWIYINSYNVNRNIRKHILEIGGSTFSTLLIGLGAFKNTLLVRTHSRDNDTAVVSNTPPTKAASTEPPANQTPASEEATRLDGSLTKADLDALFKPMAMDDTLLDTSPICDLPEIDMQRWVLVTVVLSGRIIDVYLDGKLARSCVTRSYYKVDPTGVKVKMLDRGGFDGHVSSTNAYNYALTPSEVYRVYQSGPTGTSSTVSGWFSAIFKGK